MGKTFSYDALDDQDFVSDDLDDSGRGGQDKHKRKIKKKLDDYLEQKRLRKNLGEDDFDYLDDY
ncbi:PA3496 family putative envelope integrity protein [Pseudoalteromonas fenneropenaei]|uniref:PA3496 family putative envelope integrity protein n=1 Tax=Pseudoalteromonas fenneropenaei TaxID=1737459 RepID=A0ABV7CP11_9GAMM